MVKIVEKRLTDPELAVTALPTTLLHFVFLLVPLGLLVVLTFQASELYQLVWTWDLQTWADVFTGAYYWKILLHTLTMAAVCVVLCILLSFPVAYALATRVKAFENHIKVLIIFAFLTDAVLKTYGWVVFLDKEGPFNWAIRLTGLVDEHFDTTLVYTDFATMVGMVYNYVTFMIFTIYLSLVNMERDLLQAAYDCGASKFRAFWEITVPLCRPGIWAGSFLVFVLSLGVFLESKVLGGGKNPMMGELIRQTFETRVNWPLGAALALVLMIVAVLGIVLFSRLYPLNKYPLR